MLHNKPVIMVVAGGEWQVPLIRRAKESGAFVVNTNLYEDSVGFRFADIGEVADVKDFEANLVIARRYSPDAILTDQSDIAVPTVARLCEELGLPGIGVAAAERFTNKTRMRQIGLNIGHPTPSFRECATFDELKEFFDTIDGAVVVKPIDSQSSRGVRRIDDPGILEFAFHDAIQHSSSQRVLGEEFIPGTEFTVEGIQINHRHETLAISIKRHFEHSPMVADQLLYPDEQHEFDFDRLTRQHNSLIGAMDLPFGITHAEYKYSNGEFYLIEVAARGGGTKVSSHIVPAVSGVDTYDCLIRMAQGESVALGERATVRRAALLQFFEFPAGVVAGIRGMDQATNVNGVLDIQLNFRVGDILRQSADDRSRHMHVITTGADCRAVIASARLAREQITVAYE